MPRIHLVVLVIVQAVGTSKTRTKWIKVFVLIPSVHWPLTTFLIEDCTKKNEAMETAPIGPKVDEVLPYTQKTQTRVVLRRLISRRSRAVYTV
jgi:hypothetical protein